MPAQRGQGPDSKQNIAKKKLRLYNVSGQKYK
jgi:hypothetical protein